MMTLSARLHNLNLTAFNVEEAIELGAGAEMLRGAYTRYEVPVPEWLDDSIRVLGRFIHDKSRDDMEKRIREIVQANAADMTPGERRDARRAELAALEAKLGRTPTTV